MSTVTKEQVLEVLGTVMDPDLGKDIVSLGFITKNAVCDGLVSVTINLTTPACPVKDQLRNEAEQKIRAIDGVTDVKLEMTAVPRQVESPREISPGVRHIVAISSGKGGVGKSTVAVNLACALAKTGASVGLLDCDVYGPDVPMMMGLKGQPEQNNRQLIPKERHGVQTMSLGYLLQEDKPVIWRGPMIHKLIEQFLSDVLWGELDYLLVDMPPGTGDAQLSLAQIVPLTGAVLVTTPQAVSTFDVGKAVAMFQQVNVDVLGIVENMVGYTVRGTVEGAGAGQRVTLSTGESLETDADGVFETVIPIFGEGGAELLSNKFGFPVLGRIPLDPSVRIGGDAGNPITVSDPDSALSKTFDQIAGDMVRRVAVASFASLPVLQ